MSEERDKVATTAPVNVMAAAAIDRIAEAVDRLYDLTDGPGQRDTIVAHALGDVHSALAYVVQMIEAYRDAS